MRPKIVFFQGTFDIINLGHIRSLRRAKSEGDILLVGLNSNRLMREYKHREPVLPWVHKKKIIEAIRYVDKVIKCNHFSCLDILERNHVNIYVLGKEWESTHPKEIAFMKSVGGRVVFLPRYKGGISTTEIKRRLLEEYKNG